MKFLYSIFTRENENGCCFSHGISFLLFSTAQFLVKEDSSCNVIEWVTIRLLFYRLNDRHAWKWRHMPWNDLRDGIETLAPIGDRNYKWMMVVD
eukprot:Seg4669.1 transcript_id=Seg4669.1/GoldUCD/mRNA.D3Y31 product="hypothetical protein" protein_id=Seg4669.1/GoldUCD/D3Y31